MTATPGRAVTRADVARYAGVSTAVVSYVVNNGPKTVAPETAARVRRAVEILDYRPNVHAQALRRGTNEMIGLVLLDQANPFFAEFAGAIAAEASDHAHALMIATSREGTGSEPRLIDDLVRRQVDGLIVATEISRPDLLLSRSSRDARIVWIDSWGGVPGYPSVGTDGRRGTAHAVEHLITVHGHTSVGLVTGPSANGGIPDPREVGWQQALRMAGLATGPVARVEWSREGGYAGGRQLLDADHPPTAIFASSDLQGVGVLRAAHEAGVRVPEDLAVIAFDGTKEAEFSWPPLTVVQQPVHDMAVAAVRLALDPQRSTAYEQFPGTLVLRRSCGCAG